nr:AraC family ligand binding domain-containing protein [Secundilactobacillus collinoides]
MTDFFYETITPNRNLPFHLLIHDTGEAHQVLSHWHQSFELAYVISGENRNFIINDQRFDQLKGEAVVVNPYKVHSLNLPKDHERIAITVMLPNDILTASNVTAATRIQNRIPDDGHLQRLFTTLYQTTRHLKDSGTQAEQIGLVYLILSRLVSQYSSVNPGKQLPKISAQMDHLSPVITWIDHHYQEKNHGGKTCRHCQCLGKLFRPPISKIFAPDAACLCYKASPVSHRKTAINNF